MADTKTEIKLYVEKALAKENLKNINIEILGNSEKGDGYMGDILFITANGTDNTTNKEKTLNLVLKCSKKNPKLRESSGMKEAFLNEINFYNTILPEFQQYQKSKSIQNVFDNVPKYYGHFMNDNTEIIALENLKKIGYEMFDYKIALNSQHLMMIVKKYGEFHAISAALQNENPQKFYELSGKLTNLTEMFMDSSANADKMFVTVVSEAHDLLKNSCDEKILEKLKIIEKKSLNIYTKLGTGKENFRVICHNDCWNNNFMWTYHDENNKTSPKKVLILDWQTCLLVSPIMDLSYLIFSCISTEDLNNFDIILNTYYNSFSETLKQMGFNAEDIYSKTQFLNDWQKFARYGFIIGLLVIKYAFANKEDLPDMEKGVEEGLDAAESFIFQISDKEGYKKRIKPIVEFAYNNKLID